MMAYESGAIRLTMIMFLYLIMIQNKPTVASKPTTLIIAKNQISSSHQLETNRDYSISQVNSTGNSASSSNTTQQRTIDQVPQSQRLALQLIIQDAPDDAKRNSTNNDANKDHSSRSNNDTTRDSINTTSSYSVSPKNKTTTSKGYTLKRPYDIQYVVGNTLEMYSPNLIRNLYLLELENIKKMNNYEGQEYRKKQEPAKKKIIMNQRNELLRTQHRPPWRWRDPPAKTSHHHHHHHDLSLPDLNSRTYKLRYTTMMPTTISTTTEFFKLISSAHSPIIRQYNTPPATLQERTGNISTANKLRGSHGFRTRTSRAPMIISYETAARATSTPYPSSIADRFKLNLPDDRVLSPAIIVQGGDSESESNRNQHDGNDLLDGDGDRDNVVRAGNFDGTISNNSSGSNSNSNIDHNYSYSNTNSDSNSSTTDSSREINTSLQFDDDQELSPKFSPLTFFNGKKPVTIIRQTRPRLPPIILLPSRIRIPPPRPLPPPPTNPPPQLVRLIAKQKHKYDDNIMSPTLTVVDTDFNRLPPNSTSVHNNKLIVAIRPGRPQRKHPTTTQFPVYNIVAGITPPYPNNPTMMPYTRPPSYDGSVYGLLRPHGVDNSSSIVTQSPSNFGSSNIKFPAAEPTNIRPDHVDTLPDKFNITVPESANNIGPNNVPDRLIIETDEQLSRPPDAVVQSDAHIVSRPSGSDLVKISTTRKPPRGGTTQRVSIVSANTTVVTTNPEQLHEVLSNVIDSHQQGHHQVYHNTNGNRPHLWSNIFNYLSQLINSGVATSAFAILTLIKTIFVALLVMFLPPMALAAAILQVISIG